MFTSRKYQPQNLRITQVLDSFRKPTASPEPHDSEIPWRTMRGYLYSKDYGQSMEFQFNPTEIQVNKRHIWEYRSYTGKFNVDPIWIRGEAKTMSFTLFFDASAGAQISSTGGRIILSGKNTFNDVVDSQRWAVPEYGTLPQIEMLEKFSYPLPDDISKPRFVNSVAVLNQRFSSVPTLEFNYGPMYIVCKLTELSFKHMAFNKGLVPIQSEAQVTLTVIEGIILATF